MIWMTIGALLLAVGVMMAPMPFALVIAASRELNNREYAFGFFIAAAGCAMAIGGAMLLKAHPPT